ncbi:MAG TPA: hypothetical protein VMO17_06865 [Terriglobia bacterium]|nr:hypothetical protein [Terriglobia bacterium]
MRKKVLITFTLVLLVMSVAGVPWAGAQEPAKQSEPQLKPADTYKVEFTVNELDNGKKINARVYSMQIRAEAVPRFSDMKRLRVGTRVPISTGHDQFQYMDVGMNIDCRLLPMTNSKVAIGTSLEYSSLGGETTPAPQNPVIRNVRSDVEAIVLLDKPTVLAEMDDVASTHRYTFEVKVTKVAE